MKVSEYVSSAFELYLGRRPVSGVPAFTSYFSTRNGDSARDVSPSV